MTEKPKTVCDCLQGVRHDEVDRGELEWWCRDWGGGLRENVPEPSRGSSDSSRGVNGGLYRDGDRVCYAGLEWVRGNVLHISSWDVDVRVTEGWLRNRWNRTPLLPISYLSIVQNV